ncbi:MAG: hypothetical protein EAZ78_08160 [Oscillatoriales cyanobacterium]|nr:MAG: hypothetical protein EAZ78_08160 [Oscillatoriales cyanobacterium]TAF63681.1 MAG: hypothetical protein EAZ59_20360 [Oscillatoriales cyanobacterium]
MGAGFYHLSMVSNITGQPAATGFPKKQAIAVSIVKFTWLDRSCYNLKIIFVITNSGLAKNNI